jgi:hypothetical protein
MILGTLGAAILFAESIFSGLPILLHHASEHQGNMHVTVIDKKLRGSRYQCSPALIIEEFNWFGSNRICIDDQMYSQFGIGDTLIANGMVSSFAIEVESITRK